MNAQEKQQQAKNIVELVNSQIDANLTQWIKNEHCAGLWDYANLTIDDKEFRIGVSGGLVISIDEHPFGVRNEIIDNADSFKAKLLHELEKRIYW